MKFKVNFWLISAVMIVFLFSCTQDGDPIVQEDEEDIHEPKEDGIFSSINPTWESLIGNIPRATTNEEREALRSMVSNGTINTKGTQVEVPNSILEVGEIGSRMVMADDDMRWHNPLTSQTRNPDESTRWYQKEGNTQVFRVFPGDQNWQSSRSGAGRSEAFAPNLGIRRDDNEEMTFSARYHVAAHNGSRDVKIFQSKATAAGGFDPAWGVSLHVTAAGNIDIIKRGITWAQNERISTGKSVGQSFDLLVTDDGLNYRVFIDNVEMASGIWDRENLLSVCRWGAYVQGGSEGILTGSVNNPQIVYVSGARVKLIEK